MIEGIDHINIVVNDLEKSADFYKKYFDFKEDGRKKLNGEWIEELTGLKNIQAEVIFLSHEKTDTRIELLKYFSPAGEYMEKNLIPNTLGIRHMAFKTNNFDTLIQKLKKDGITFIGGPKKIFEPVDKYKSKICYFLDPDKVLLEITGF
ncbi:MAG: VOC family protein [Desulforegulaceae bacterium]|nr:VOC family protein [Desulforegulaceae bacterium]